MLEDHLYVLPVLDLERYTVGFVTAEPDQAPSVTCLSLEVLYQSLKLSNPKAPICVRYPTIKLTLETLLVSSLDFKIDSEIDCGESPTIDKATASINSDFVPFCFKLSKLVLSSVCELSYPVVFWVTEEPYCQKSKYVVNKVVPIPATYFLFLVINVSKKSLIV